jgi:putative component of membrane protein insertase Oxa1/YidC/SpoIIIJ protein YidD
MQSTQRGLIALGATRLLPISKLLQTIGLGQFTNQLADLAVRNYQKHLSPHKGFSCAYCRLYGGASCSGYFREVLADRGLSQALRLFPDRLQACQKANYILRMQMSSESTSESDANVEAEELDDRDSVDDGEEQPTNTNTRYKSSNNCSNSCNSSDCDAVACDAGACDTGACDAGACDTGACDTGACDAGACDAGACDTGGCDGGGCDGCNF